MRKRLLDLKAMVAAVEPFLPQYLQEHGYDTSKNFTCLDPRHDDRNASATLKQNSNLAYCFGCQSTFSIFRAAHLLEGKSLKGRTWIEDNLLYLAKKYGVNLQMQDLTPEEIYEFRTYKAYEFAAELITNPKLGDYTLVKKETKTRGWDINKLSDWGIGTICFQDFWKILKNAGYEAGFLRGIDLDRSALFNEDNLIFTVYDDEFKPVGFSARNLKYKEGDPNSGPKFNSSRTTGLECNIFKKGERLYGFEIAKDAGSPLYIFEGQLDVTTAKHHGVMNCCCTMGTAFTDHHINLLKKHGAFNIILVFDGDEAGRRATEKVLDEKFSKHKDFRIQLIQLPDNVDPDIIFRTGGIDKFLNLRRWTAFEWRLSKLLENYDGEDEEARITAAEKMAPLIASEANIIRQEEKCKQVAKMTGYEFTTILAEVKRLRNIKDAEVQARKRGAVEAFADKVKWNPDEAESALNECRLAIETIDRENERGGGKRTTIDFILSQKERDEAKTGKFEGFVLNPEGLGGIGARLNGDWRRACLMYIGGSEQSLKSTLAAQLSYEIAKNPENNAIVIYHSIDDAARFILYKWVCRAANDTTLEINHIGNPKYWEAKKNGIVKLREKGYKEIVNLVKDNKLILRDSTHGVTLSYFEAILRDQRERNPDVNIVTVIDSFHKIHEMGSKFGQDNERIKKISNRLKNMSTQYDSTIVATAEYRKQQPGELPSNVALAGSAGLQYDATVILHLYNEVHILGEDKAILIHQEKEKTYPRLFVKYGKNKIAGYEDREFLDTYPASATLKAVDKQTAINDQYTRQQYLEENSDRGGIR